MTRQVLREIRTKQAKKGLQVVKKSANGSVYIGGNLHKGLVFVAMKECNKKAIFGIQHGTERTADLRSGGKHLKATGAYTRVFAKKVISKQCKLIKD